MRRMATTKQLELLEYLSKGIKINNYPEEMIIPFKYTNKEEIEEFLQGKLEDEELDFETHTLDSAYMYYYYDTDFENGAYVEIDNDDPFSFPETINTISELADWLKNNLPIIELSYIADLELPDLPNIDKYDFEDHEYEFINGILYAIGYNASQYSMLEAGIDTINSNQIFTNALGSTTNPIAKGYITNINTAHVKASTEVEALMVTATGQLYGQLGLSNRRKSAYVATLDANYIKLPGASDIEYNTDNDNFIIRNGDDRVILEDSTITLNCQDGTTTLGLNGDGLYIGGDSTGNSTGEVVITTQTFNINLESANAQMRIFSLPTSDPHVANALWNDNGTLKISAGE